MNMKKVVAHPGCLETPEGVLKKALIEIAPRCKSLVIIGLGKDDDPMSDFLRASTMKNADLAYMSVILSAFVHYEIERGHYSPKDSSKSDDPPA